MMKKSTNVVTTNGNVVRCDTVVYVSDTWSSQIHMEDWRLLIEKQANYSTQGYRPKAIKSAMKRQRFHRSANRIESCIDTWIWTFDVLLAFFYKSLFEIWGSFVFIADKFGVFCAHARRGVWLTVQRGEGNVHKNVLCACVALSLLHVSYLHCCTPVSELARYFLQFFMMLMLL